MFPHNTFDGFDADALLQQFHQTFGDAPVENIEKIIALKEQAAKLCGREVIPVSAVPALADIQQQIAFLPFTAQQQLQGVNSVIEQVISELVLAESNNLNQIRKSATQVNAIFSRMGVEKPRPAAPAPAAVPRAAPVTAPAGGPAPASAEEVERKEAAARASEPVVTDSAAMAAVKRRTFCVSDYCPTQSECFQVLDGDRFIFSKSDLPADKNVLKIHYKIQGLGESRYATLYLQVNENGSLIEFIRVGVKNIDYGNFRNLDDFINTKLRDQNLSPQDGVNDRLVALRKAEQEKQAAEAAARLEREKKDREARLERETKEKEATAAAAQLHGRKNAMFSNVMTTLKNFGHYLDIPNQEVLVAVQNELQNGQYFLTLSGQSHTINGFVKDISGKMQPFSLEVNEEGTLMITGNNPLEEKRFCENLGDFIRSMGTKGFSPKPSLNQQSALRSLQSHLQGWVGREAKAQAIETLTKEKGNVFLLRRAREANVWVITSKDSKGAIKHNYLQFVYGKGWKVTEDQPHVGKELGEFQDLDAIHGKLYNGFLFLEPL